MSTPKHDLTFVSLPSLYFFTYISPRTEDLFEFQKWKWDGHEIEFPNWNEVTSSKPGLSYKKTNWQDVIMSFKIKVLFARDWALIRATLAGDNWANWVSLYGPLMMNAEYTLSAFNPLECVVVGGERGVQHTWLWSVRNSGGARCSRFLETKCPTLQMRDISQVGNADITVGIRHWV